MSANVVLLGLLAGPQPHIPSLPSDCGNFFTEMDAEQFRRAGHELIDFIADYYTNLEKYKVVPGTYHRPLPLLYRLLSYPRL